MNGIQEIQTCADAPNVNPFIGIENAKLCGKRSMKKKHWDDEKISILDNYLRSDKTYEEISLLMGISNPALRHAKSRFLHYPGREKRPNSMYRRFIKDVKNGTRKCNICGQDTPFRLLVKNSHRKCGYEPLCKACRNGRDAKKMKSLKQYRISREEYLSILEKQAFVCAICGRSNESRNGRKIRLVVDHCHDTLKVRGLLCGRCNIALGQFHDDKGILSSAIAYLS